MNLISKWFFVVFFLFGCAFHSSLDTTKWAESQDLVIAGKAPCQSVDKYEALSSLQRAIGATNLTIREDLIEGVCNHDTARIEAGRKDARSLIRDGYWVEGYSYALYTQSAFLWAALHDLDTVVAKYSRLVAPDGSVPIPETRIVSLPVPSVVSNNLDFFYMDSTYLVRSWRRGWVLICLNVNPTCKYNLHVHSDFGAYSWYRNGKWEHRVAAYTGFKLQGEGDGLGLPWDVSTWRVNDKPRKVLRADMWAVVLTYGNDTLSFGFGDSLTVTYNKGER